jgi:hypothetical protein
MTALDVERTRRFAAGTARASRRQLGLSVALIAGIIVVLVAIGAPTSALVKPACIGVFLIAVHTRRLVLAKAELRQPRADGAFIRSHRRSHLLRGRIFLVACPILVLYTLTRLWLEEPPAPTGAWLATAGIVGFLGVGYVWWIRALRDVRKWPR